MKMKLATAVTALCAALSMPAAFAADGQIDFVGEINGNTCNINGGQPNFQVDLPSVSLTALATVGQSAGRRPFALNLTGCVPDTGKVATYFEAGPTISPTSGRLVTDTGAGQADFVEVALLNDGFEQMELNQVFPGQKSQLVDIEAGSANLKYYAEYVATGQVTAGEVNTRVMYSLVYP